MPTFFEPVETVFLDQVVQFDAGHGPIPRKRIPEAARGQCRSSRNQAGDAQSNDQAFSA